MWSSRLSKKVLQRELQGTYHAPVMLSRVFVEMTVAYIVQGFAYLNALP